VSGILNKTSQCSVEDSVMLEELTGIDAKLWYAGSKKQIQNAWQARIRNESMKKLKELQAKRRNGLKASA